MSLKKISPPKLVNPKLRKANQLIHVDAREIGLAERKLYNVLLYHAVQSGVEDEYYSIPVSRIRTYLSLKGDDSRTIEQAVTRLQKTIVQGNLLSKIGDDIWESVQMLGYARLESGLLLYSIPREIKPLLFSPQVFSVIRLAVASLFKSKYSLALYENCYRFLKVHSTGWIELDKWRQLLGVPSDARLYSGFAMLNARVFKPAIEEVNKLSDIVIEMRVDRRLGTNAVSHIAFSIEGKNQFALPFTPMEQGNLPGIDAWKASSGAMRETIRKLVEKGVLPAEKFQHVTKA
jgi:hypothetical protein